MTLNDDGTHVSEEYGMDEKNPASWEDIPPVVMHPDGAVDFGFDSEWDESNSDESNSFSYTSGLQSPGPTYRCVELV